MEDTDTNFIILFYRIKHIEDLKTTATISKILGFFIIFFLVIVHLESKIYNF